MIVVAPSQLLSLMIACFCFVSLFFVLQGHYVYDGGG